MIEVIKYAGGGVILIAGVLLGIIIERARVQRRKTMEYKRERARLPRATKEN